MAPEPLQRRRGLVRTARALVTAALATAALSVATLPGPGLFGATPVPTAAPVPWWQPLAFAGRRVDSVTTAGGTLLVSVGLGHYASTDGGATFAPVATPGPAASAPGAVAPATGDDPPLVGSAGHLWTIRHGTVLTGSTGASLAPDPGAPFLGSTAHLIAAPAALPGVVAAVGSDGHVWRRGADGGWATAFVLLPAGGLAGTPRVTGLAAFSRPLTAAVYLGTDGYGVLLSSDGGDDWIRAGAGLPGSVLGLATIAATRSLYAATAGGLWVHRLQSFPAPPVYRDADAVLRWVGIGIVALLSALLALAGLRVALPARPP